MIQMMVIDKFQFYLYFHSFCGTNIGGLKWLTVNRLLVGFFGLGFFVREGKVGFFCV